MKPAHSIVIANLREITGHIRPVALANAIHARVPSSWGGAFFITLNNIRDCIEGGDRWFEEETPEGFRVSTDSGFSCIVRDRLAFCSAPMRRPSSQQPRRSTPARDRDSTERR